MASWQYKHRWIEHAWSVVTQGEHLRLLQQQPIASKHWRRKKKTKINTKINTKKINTKN